MFKFRTKLTFIFITLIGLSVLASGIFVAKMVQQSHIENLRNHLLRELRIISTTVDWQRTGSESELIAYYSAEVNKLKESANARITYIRADGKVLADSDTDPAQMDNHLTRPEIIEAGRNNVGEAIRFSQTTQSNMLYVAVPMKNDGAVTGYLRLSISLTEIEQSIEHIWYVLVAGLFALFIVAGLISFRIAHGITQPIAKITRVAQQITHMNYKARVKFRKGDEIGQLGQAINRMADSLQMQMDQILENESRTKSVLENMPSGLLMIDKDGRIMLLNRSAEDILAFLPPSWWASLIMKRSSLLSLPR